MHRRKGRKMKNKKLKKTYRSDARPWLVPMFKEMENIRERIRERRKRRGTPRKEPETIILKRSKKNRNNYVAPEEAYRVLTQQQSSEAEVERDRMIDRHLKNVEE
jgi:hypothetical protein